MEHLLAVVTAMFKGRFIEILLISSTASLIRFIAVLLNITKFKTNRPIGQICILILLDLLAMLASVLLGLTTWLVAESAGTEEWKVMTLVIVSSIVGFSAVSAIVKITFDGMVNASTDLTTNWLKLKTLKIIEAINKFLKETN